MRRSPKYPEDLELVDRCLAGNSRAIGVLHEKYHGALGAFLSRMGAGAEEVNELITTLWTDCIQPHGKNRPLFFKYRGQCALGYWLKAVVLNRIIDKRREDGHYVPLPDDEEEGKPIGITMPERTNDPPLLDLMRRALNYAIDRSPSEHFVMLQLVHYGNLTQSEVGRMWKMDESKISRILHQTQQALETDILTFIKQEEPFLDLTWDDFVQLCDSVDRPLFQ